MGRLIENNSFYNHGLELRSKLYFFSVMDKVEAQTAPTKTDQLNF